MTDRSRFQRVPRTSVTDDRILDGREVHEVPQLTAVLAALRDLSDVSATPNAALPDVLEGGIRPEQVGASDTPAALSAHRPLLEVMTAKLAGLGLLAQIGVGVAAASAITVGAATTDTLPGPAQDAVAGLVARISPFELPGSADAGEQVSGDAHDQTPGVSGTDIADQVAPVSPPPVDDRPVADTPPGFDDEAEPPGFDVVEDTPAVEQVTPPTSTGGSVAPRHPKTPATSRTQVALRNHLPRRRPQIPPSARRTSRQVADPAPQPPRSTNHVPS